MGKHPLMSLFARTSNSLLRTSTSSITSTRTIANKSIYANLYKNTRGFKSTTSKMGVHNLSSKADFAAALKDNKIVVLDCFATWCGPCKVTEKVKEVVGANPNALKSAIE